MQEVLIRVYRGLDDFRGESSLRTWMLRIVTRVAADLPRRRSRTPAGSHDAVVDVPDGLAHEPIDTASARELHDRLDEALERLPGRQRAALHLRAFEGLDYAGIADTLECSAGAARMLVLEARKRVAARMGRYLEP